MNYCISDIHGCYAEFMMLLEQLRFCDDDTLYVLGDVIDRGEASLRCLDFIMKARNIKMLMGNHEYMMLNALLRNDGFENWYDRNGGSATLAEFETRKKSEQEELLSYLAELPYYFELKLGQRAYLLVHAGINPKLTLENQSEKDMVWLRNEFYEEKAFGGSTVIFGHTPTWHIDVKSESKIWHDKKHNDKICIDCGCVYGRTLAALRLEDLAEFYVHM